MRLTKPFLIPVAAAALVATQSLAADDPAWIVKAGTAGAGSMSRTVDNVTLNYTRHTADYDSLRLTVRECGDTPWDIDEGLDQVTAETLRASAKEEFANARLNCKIADGVEERVMTGFDEAFARVKPILPPHTATIDGWQLADVGGMPGDDSERKLTMVKALPNLTMSYQHFDQDRAAIEFKCEGSGGYSTGFDFGNPPEDHVKVITAEVTEAYPDLNKDCKPKPPAQAVLMQDFPEALATLEGWLKAKPFVYPPETSADQGK